MADGDLERRLGEVLRDRAGGFTPSGDLPARIGARTRQRAHNRRVAASVAAVAVVLGVAAPLALRDGGDDQERATLAAESVPATTAAGAADSELSDSAGATARSGEAGADTTAAASPDEAVAAADTIAGSTEAAPEASGAPPAPAPTSTVATAADAESAPPPYLLAVMPGDDRVALVSTDTGDVVRHVEGGDPTGEVFYDDAGEIVFRAGGCGTSAQGVAVTGDDVVISDTAWRDAVAITAWGSGPSQRFAWVTDKSCNGESGFTLTVRTSAGDRSLPVPEAHDLAFSPDGTALVWSESDGLAGLDLDAPGSPSWRTPSPDPGCPVAAVSTIDGTPRVAVITECAGELARLFSLDPGSGQRPLDQGTGFAEVDAIDYDATAQWVVATHSSGTEIVSAVTSDVVTTIPGARSAHWTTATG